MGDAFKYFEEILCINLDRRQDRWELMQSEFEKIGILERVKRFCAIEDQNGERGCFESHMQCILYAREKKLKNVLIFEDDVVFLPCYNENKIKKSIDVLSDHSWEFYYMGGLERRIKPRPKYNKLKEKYEGEYNDDYDYLMECVSVGWAQSYAVNNSIYDRIYKDYNNGLWEIVDKKFNGKPGGADKYYQHILCPKTFVSVPSMTSQYDIKSDLSRTHTNKSLRVKIK